MNVIFHNHAKQRMQERGITEEEIRATIAQGEQFPVKYGRTGFRRNLIIESEWRGKTYQTKQVEVYAIQENSDWIVITLIAKYF